MLITTKRSARNYLLWAAAVCLLCCACPEARAVDENNCLFCHSYRGLSYINKEGRFKLLYVTEDLYLNSPHGNLKCADCHVEVKKFPHGDVKKVNCLVTCHMDEPSSRLPFSHQNVGDYLTQSVHSKVDSAGKPKPYQEDYPECVTCHMDPLYRPLAFLQAEKPGLEAKTIQRCSICHQEKAFMSKFFSHFTSRMQKLRKPLEIITMCGSCHGNTDMMKRHNLPNLVKSYMETYHGKALSFGDEKAADCNDCHVLPGQSIHSVKSMRDPQAASYKNNIYLTCSDIDCHPNAALNLAGYKAHVIIAPQRNPLEFYVCVFFVVLTIGSFIPLMLFTVLDMARNVFPKASLLKEKKEE